ncbi:MAG TPA: M1 family metallopeptidase [Micropruina sp.]|nr:M1 family metallopeptidase [Micropruina sp.]HMR22235.1 M1 family metallopeptidase [Micropruina sp.]
MPAADPYVPGHGDRRYAVRSYRLELDYKVATNHLNGRATLETEALEHLDQIGLDLYGLNVSRVRVNGRPVRYTHRERKLRIGLAAAARPGDRLSIDVDYAGKPRPIPSVFGPVGWEELTDGVLVAAQPCGAPSWFPCNDRPDDKARYRFAVTVADGYRVIANGVLEGRDKRSGRTTWRYRQTEPMASYLAVLHVGRYVATSAGERVDLVHPRGVAVGAGTAFARQADMLDTFGTLFGPYPFDRYAAVITADELEIPLEAQTLSTFGANHVAPGWENERLVAHELAHQWFGNSLTAAEWSDIWLHEGFACYSEWLWSEASGRRTAAAWAAEHHGRLAVLPQDLVLGAPGRELMFDDRVYKRGALTVHALRAALGDAFFPMLRDWTAANRWSSVTTEAFVAHAQRYTDADVAALIDAWVYGAPLPALPAC